MFHMNSPTAWVRHGRKAALVVLAISALGSAAGAGTAQAKPIGACDGPCQTAPTAPSDPRGGRIGCDDCKGPGWKPPPKVVTPPLLTQAEIRRGKTVYGACAQRGDTVTCSRVRLATLVLPASFAVRQHNVPVNAVAVEAFRRVVNAIDRAGLGPRVKEFGTHNRRPCRYVSGRVIPGCVSIHSWGLAVDVNSGPGRFYDTYPGGPLEGVRNIFLAHGFVWGKTFRGNVDPPHFQYAKL